MTEIENSNQRPEVAELQMQLQRALFPQELSEDSPFNAFEEEIRPSEVLLDREQEIRDLTREFIEMANYVVSAPPEMIRNPLTRVRDTGQGSTYSHATIEVKESTKPNARNKYPGRQLYVVETAPIVTGDAEEDAYNWEGIIRSQEAQLLNRQRTLSERSTASAAEHLRDAENKLAQLRQLPIETKIIQLQHVDEQGNHQPELGIKIIRTLDGVQAYPLIYRGKEPFVLQSHPLLKNNTEGEEIQGRTWKVEELGITLQSATIPEADYAKTAIAKVEQKIFNKAGFGKR